jgi:hypothetical protein
MTIDRIETQSGPIARIVSDTIVLRTTQDALDLMAACRTRAMIIDKENIAPEFFDLKTRLLGEIMQKFVNYSFRAAIIGDFSGGSKNFQDFLFECNKTGTILFLGTEVEAIKRLAP